MGEYYNKIYIIYFIIYNYNIYFIIIIYILLNILLLFCIRNKNWEKEGGRRWSGIIGKVSSIRHEEGNERV